MHYKEIKWKSMKLDENVRENCAPLQHVPAYVDLIHQLEQIEKEEIAEYLERAKEQNRICAMGLSEYGSEHLRTGVDIRECRERSQEEIDEFVESTRDEIKELREGIIADLVRAVLSCKER